jgi:hypothetical protein
MLDPDLLTIVQCSSHQLHYTLPSPVTKCAGKSSKEARFWEKTTLWGQGEKQAISKVSTKEILLLAQEALRDQNHKGALFPPFVLRAAPPDTKLQKKAASYVHKTRPQTSSNLTYP